MADVPLSGQRFSIPYSGRYPFSITPGKPQALSAMFFRHRWHGGTSQLTLSTATMNFGSLPLNVTATQTLTLTSSGTAAVTVNSATLSGTGFSITGTTFPITLNPEQTATLLVSFDPTVAGAASGAITISSNSSSGSTAMVSLTGTGTTPQLTLSASSVSFGDDPVGTTVSQPVTLTSSGTAPVTISGASITGTGFTFTGATFPVTLNPTIGLTIQAQFDPITTGAASGTLTFASNSMSGSTSVVNLSGTGTAVQHQASLSWTAPTSSPVPVSGYNIYRATGNSTSFQRLNASNDAQTNYVDPTVVASTTYTYYVTSVDSEGTESVPSNQVTMAVP